MDILAEHEEALYKAYLNHGATPEQAKRAMLDDPIRGAIIDSMVLTASCNSSVTIIMDSNKYKPLEFK